MTINNVAHLKRVVFLILLSVIVIFFGKDREDYYDDDKTIKEDAGKSLKFETISTLFDNKTRITTNKGVFLVKGTFQGVSDVFIFIENRSNGLRYLCYGIHKPKCLILIEN